MIIQEILTEYAPGTMVEVWVRRPGSIVEGSYVGVFRVGDRTLWESVAPARPWPEVRDALAPKLGYLPIICRVRPLARTDKENMRLAHSYDGRTEYLQGDDAREFMRNGHCECCLRAADEWAEPDRFGNVEMFGEYDCDGNLTGFACPTCVKLREL